MHMRRLLAVVIAAALLVPIAGSASFGTAAADDPQPGTLLGLLAGLPTLLTPPSAPTPTPTPTPTPSPNPSPAPGEPTPTPTATPASDGGPTDDTWIGIDGQLHSTSTDPVVDGLPGSGEMFSAWEFDDACRAGQSFVAGLDWVNRIAKLIKRSGRTVVWTVAPNKTNVDRRLIDPSTAPQGACALQGIQQQASVLNTYPGTNYMPLTRSIASDHRRTYWRSDLHWTSVGASIWVKMLAQRLSPRIARAQRWQASTASYWGLFHQYRDDNTMETEPAIVPAPGVRVVSTKGVEPEAALPPPSVLQRTDDIKDLRWVTETRRPTWPGRTLLLGDSFTFSSLQLMRPLFRRGEFLWYVVNDPATIARAVLRSNTVVLEVFQVGASRWGAQAFPALYYAIRDALRAHH